MIDFHSHILPGMDDGSKSVEESIAMLRMLSEQGIKTVVATPHFYANHESVGRFLRRREISYNRLLSAMDEGLPRVLLGAEVRFYSGIGGMRDLRELCVQDRDLLLLEMPFSKWTGYTVKEVIDLYCTGNVSVVLAHIDRYLNFNGSGVWKQLLENDILMQVNAEFFNGFFTGGKALRLLRSGGVHFLGSDCHNLTSRAPNIGDAYSKIENKLGDDFLNKFVKYEYKLLGL